MAFVTLRVLHGADRGKVFEHLSTPVTVGREEGNTIQLNDERISRYHLKLQEDDDKVILTDLESTNGTKVNGEDIQVRIVRHGDMIYIANSESGLLRVKWNAEGMKVDTRRALTTDDWADMPSRPQKIVVHNDTLFIMEPYGDAVGVIQLCE